MSNRVATEPGHLAWDTLVDYWLGEIDATATEAIDEHLLNCDACGASFDELARVMRSITRKLKSLSPKVSTDKHPYFIGRSLANMVAAGQALIFYGNGVSPMQLLDNK